MTFLQSFATYVMVRTDMHVNCSLTGWQRCATVRHSGVVICSNCDMYCNTWLTVYKNNTDSFRVI